MFKINYNLDVLKKLQNSLNRLPGNVKTKVSRNIVEDTLKRGEEFAKVGFTDFESSPSSGGLRQNVRQENVSDRGGILETRGPHASIIERGGVVVVKDYTFVPGHGMVMTPGGRHIAHFRPKWWFKATAEAMESDIDRIATQHIGKALRDAVK